MLLSRSALVVLLLGGPWLSSATSKAPSKENKMLQKAVLEVEKSFEKVVEHDLHNWGQKLVKTLGTVRTRDNHYEDLDEQSLQSALVKLGSGRGAHKADLQDADGDDEEGLGGESKLGKAKSPATKLAEQVQEEALETEGKDDDLPVADLSSSSSSDNDASTSGSDSDSSTTDGSTTDSSTGSSMDSSADGSASAASLVDATNSGITAKSDCDNCQSSSHNAEDDASANQDSSAEQDCTVCDGEHCHPCTVMKDHHVVTAKPPHLEHEVQQEIQEALGMTTSTTTLPHPAKMAQKRAHKKHHAKHREDDGDDDDRRPNMHELSGLDDLKMSKNEEGDASEEKMAEQVEQHESEEEEDDQAASYGMPTPRRHKKHKKRAKRSHHTKKKSFYQDEDDGVSLIDETSRMRRSSTAAAVAANAAQLTEKLMRQELSKMEQHVTEKLFPDQSVETLDGQQPEASALLEEDPRDAPRMSASTLQRVTRANDDFQATITEKEGDDLSKTEKDGQSVVRDLGSVAGDAGDVGSSLLKGARVQAQSSIDAVRSDNDKMLVDIAKTTRDLVTTKEDLDDTSRQQDAFWDAAPVNTGSMPGTYPLGGSDESSTSGSLSDEEEDDDHPASLLSAGAVLRNRTAALAKTGSKNAAHATLASMEKQSEEDVRHTAVAANSTVQDLKAARALLKVDGAGLADEGRDDAGDEKRLARIVADAMEDNDRAMAGTVAIREDMDAESALVTKSSPKEIKAASAILEKSENSTSSAERGAGDQASLADEGSGAGLLRREG